MSVLSVPEAAELLGVSVKAVYELTHRGRIPYRKRGTRTIFIREELNQYLQDLPGVTLAEALEQAHGQR